MCAEACHFYIGTKDPKYTPIWKLEPFKQAYKREYGPLSILYRSLGLKKKVTADELEEWQHLLYDSCTVCGRCSLVCPMGIDISSIVAASRQAFAAAGRGHTAQQAGIAVRVRGRERIEIGDRVERDDDGRLGGATRLRPP